MMICETDKKHNRKYFFKIFDESFDELKSNIDLYRVNGLFYNNSPLL